MYGMIEGKCIRKNNFPSLIPNISTKHGTKDRSRFWARLRFGIENVIGRREATPPWIAATKSQNTTKLPRHRR
ncbi:unnamed protein product [Lupinus luteus]|uniref:Uncharacterized protein n=1 Tax=Lupinus luteus TaxID=3873 RepID=A0AAV1XVF6_LUPLU